MTDNNSVKLYNRIKHNGVTPEHQWQIKDSDNCYISMSTKDLESLIHVISKELSDDIDNEKGYHYIVIKASNAKSRLDSSSSSDNDDYKVVVIKGQAATKAPEL